MQQLLFPPQFKGYAPWRAALNLARLLDRARIRDRKNFGNGLNLPVVADQNASVDSHDRYNIGQMLKVR